MVERLKIAVEKARRQRGLRTGRPASPSIPADTEAEALPAAWAALETEELDPAHLERNRIVSYAKSDPAYAAFDVLRTRILRVFQRNGWTRLGITSPGPDCGKTFVAANLAMSLARQQDCRTILMDMDLRSPSLADVLGVERPEPISWFLKGDIPADAHLRLFSNNLALGVNDKKVADAAELVQSTTTGEILDDMIGQFVPDMVIYDLPPMLLCDDVLAFLPQVDCILLVAGGGRTRASDVTECERLLTDQTHLLGVLLNKAEGETTTTYSY